VRDNCTEPGYSLDWDAFSALKYGVQKSTSKGRCIETQEAGIIEELSDVLNVGIVDLKSFLRITRILIR
jgi:hypothetical protein